MQEEINIISDYIRKEMGYQGDIDPNVDLLEEQIMDSFSVVQLAMFLQEQFDIELEAEDIARENLAKLSSMVALIERKKDHNRQ